MYDVIVIGSGIGGLTAGGLLAGVAGKKVLILEKHLQAGGLTHVFRRDGASWDVGLHYVGEIEPGSRGRAFFDYLSGGELRWSRMPDPFERFVYPGIDISVPSNPAGYEQMLIEMFPQEKAELKRYFADIRCVTRWNNLSFMKIMMPKQVQPLLHFIQKLTGKLATLTTGKYLTSRFRSPELRAVLASQWGDYGLPPNQSAFAIHAQIVNHYLQGGWYPEGGAARILRTFEKGIERAGGSILVGQNVIEILIESGKAVGVRVIDQRGPKPVEKIYRAEVIISNAGVPITFEQLLPTEGEIGAKTADIRKLIKRLGIGLSVVTLYLRLKAPPQTIGIQGENHWIFTRLNHDNMADHSRGVLEGNPHGIYVSFPSIKAKDERFHTVEIITFLDDKLFAPWHDRPKGNRGADYAALKKRISDGLLKLANANIPGLADLVSYSELSTPLTVEHYTSHPGGRFYGLPAVPERYRSMSILKPRTPIEGLYLSGSDVACVGILGALMGGVGSACEVLGAKGFRMIQSALKAGPVHAPLIRLPPHKKRAVLISKRPLTPSIWHLEFQIEGNVDAYVPGQFARLHVGKGEWRDYSIAGLEAQMIRFIISTRTGGDGSHFVQNAAIGQTTEIELPLGSYTLSQSDRLQVFTATGTGLAPFLPMFQTLHAKGKLNKAVLFFRCRTIGEDITSQITPLPGKVIRYFSGEENPKDGFKGRVTNGLAEFKFNPNETDFYLCGSSRMVADSQKLLEDRGAKHLFTESF